jgi:hypothetical protein
MHGSAGVGHGSVRPLIESIVLFIGRLCDSVSIRVANTHVSNVCNFAMPLH